MRCKESDLRILDKCTEYEEWKHTTTGKIYTILKMPGGYRKCPLCRHTWSTAKRHRVPANCPGCKHPLAYFVKL